MIKRMPNILFRDIDVVNIEILRKTTWRKILLQVVFEN